MNQIEFEKINVSSAVKETESADGAVLLDIKQGICFSLNPVALRIWTMLKEHSTLDRILDCLEREFNRPRTELHNDVCDFVRQLEAKHLISYPSPFRRNTSWMTKILSSKTNDSTH